MKSFYIGLLVAFLLPLQVSHGIVRAEPVAKIQNYTLDEEDVFALARVMGFKFSSREELGDDYYNEVFQKAINNQIIYQKAKNDRPKLVVDAERLADLMLCKEFYIPYYSQFAYPRAKEIVTVEFVRQKLSPQEDQILVNQILFFNEITAAEVRAKIAEGNISFEEAAKKYSRGITGPKGGKVGYVKYSATNYSPEILDFLFSSPLGELTKVTDTALGPSLFLVEEIISGEELEIAKAKEVQDEWVQRVANEIIWADVEGKADTLDVELLLTKENYRADGASIDMSQIAIEDKTNGVEYTVGDVLARGGKADHGSKDILTIAENVWRDFIIRELYVAKGGAPLPDISRRREVIVANIVSRKMLAEFTKNISIAPNEIDSYIEENKEIYLLPDRFDLSLIYIKSKQRLEQVQNLLLSGKSFSSLATAWSQHSSSKNEGRIGIRPSSIFGGSNVENLKAMVGKVTDPLFVESGEKQGYYLFMIHAFYPAGIMDKDEIIEKYSSSIQDRLLARKREDAIFSYLSSLRQKTEIEFF